MNEPMWEQLSREYAYDSWREPSGAERLTLDAALLAPGAELDGWRSLRLGTAGYPGVRADYRSIWQSLGAPAAHLRLDLIDTSGAAEARRLVLDLLGEFQGGGLQRVDRPGVIGAGEVGFMVPGDTARLFARQNLVALISNAGREVVPVAGFAHALDEVLIEPADRAASA